MLMGIGGGANAALRALHQRCVGCGTQGRPGRSGRPNLRYERWGNRRRGTRRRGAATAIEWRAVRPQPQAVVRSTLPEARAEVSALVRARLHGAVRSEVRARSAGAPARVKRAVRKPVRGEAGTRRRMGCTGASRGDACDECCAKRRREESAAVMRALPSNAASTVAVRHAAVSEASRRASGARSERSERRREGYPPEGARPRSGLDRVARSRSDAPSLIVGSRETVSMFGTIECISVCIIVAASGTTIGIAVGARRTLSSSGARSCGGRAAGRAVVASTGPTKKKRATPPKRRGPWWRCGSGGDALNAE